MTTAELDIYHKVIIGGEEHDDNVAPGLVDLPWMHFFERFCRNEMISVDDFADVVTFTRTKLVSGQDNEYPKCSYFCKVGRTDAIAFKETQEIIVYINAIEPIDIQWMSWGSKEFENFEISKGGIDKIILETWKKAKDQLLVKVMSAHKILKLANPKLKKRKLSITGFSVGGSARFDITVYNFGQPRFANAQFRRMIDERSFKIYRITFNDDAIPQLPKGMLDNQPYQHHGPYFDQLMGNCPGLA
ncbi:hypothetical protein G9A89_004931 [Geosiphon pyriformis]|nr:hypothetical protein G9A89_004931 [Geosiphon pyriformis]